MVALLFYCLCPRHEDLKMLLDSKKDGQKLDAMKIIIGVSGHTGNLLKSVPPSLITLLMHIQTIICTCLVDH